MMTECTVRIASRARPKAGPGKAGLAIACVLLLALAGCKERVTQANYAKIQMGMTLSQVEGIMGGKGERVETTGMSISGAGVAGGSSTSVQYIWKSKGRQISVTVRDGKVVDAGSLGL